MKPNVASLINAVLLISFGLWSYMSLESKPITALIPVFIGVILLALNPGVKKENKIVAHIAVLLTLLILIGLIKPLTGSIGRGNLLGIARVAVMLLSTAFALITFIRSFIAVRKARNLEKK